MDKNLLRIEMIGVAVIAIVGILLHFCYEWSGEWQPSALFCAVNESVWEHMKIAFWPAFFFAVVEFFLLKERPENFWVAKTVGFYITTFMIPLLFYSYTAILGDHYLVIDILIFVIAIFLGQWVSYRLMSMGAGVEWQGGAIILLIAILAAYALFTYFPPEIPIFKDPQSGGYGF